jgi:hypothetical protein
MGNLTPVLISNDALHLFDKDDGELSKKIFNAINSESRYVQDVSHEGYCNYITIHPSMHSSCDRLFLVSGGSMTELDSWTSGFNKLCISHPELMKEMLKIAKQKIKDCEKGLKESKK